MLTGISENLLDVSDSRKTAVINNELLRLNVDIATIQETRLADSGALKEKDYTFYWQGNGSGEHREYGVGFGVRNSLLSMIEPGSNGSERLLTLRLNTTAGPLNLVSVYAPTMSATSDTKDEFYENLAAIISSVPNNEQLVLLGDFNASVGAPYSRPRYLREKYLKDSRLVWYEVNRNATRHRSKAHCPDCVQTVTQRKEPADSQSCQEQGSTNRDVMGERVLDTAQPGYTDSRHNREHQGNIRWH